MHLTLLRTAAACALTIACAQAATAGGCEASAPDGDLSIEISKNAQGALATYRFAQPVACIRLSNAGPVRKLTWTVLTPGARLDESGDAILMDAPRRSFKVQLRPFERDGQMDRTYSPVIAFGDGSAVAVYSRYLLGADATPKTTFRFTGFSPQAKAARVGPHKEVAGAHATYLIVGRPRLAQLGKTALLADQAMPDWLKSRVTDQLRRGAEALAPLATVPEKLSYMLTYTESQTPRAAWRGDVLPGLVRLNFMGAKWGTENPELAAVINQFVLHELFHTVSHRYRPAVAGDGTLSLSEGGAEAAAATLARRSGELDANGFTAASDAALMRCLALSGATLAAKEKNNTRVAPYACGQVLQHLAATMLKNDGARADVLTIWQALLLRQKQEAYGWKEYFDALRPLADPAALARVAMLEKLVSSELTWSEALDAFYMAGSLRKLEGAEQTAPQVSAFYAGRALFQLLDSHCRGRRGTSINEDVYTLDAPADSCSGLPDQFRVVAVNGHRLGKNAYQAYLEQARRCAAGEPVELQDEAGERQMIACSKPFTPVQLYTFGARP